MTAALPYPVVDPGLSRQLEAAEAHSNAMFVQARATLEPALGACAIEVAGTRALFDGVGSPLTQTFGLGLWEPVTAEAMDTLAHFFGSRGADVFQEVSPLADPSALALLNERGYRPCELTSVLYQPLATTPRVAAPDGELQVRPASRAEHERWIDTACEGWSAFAGLGEFMAAFGRVVTSAPDVYPFLALDGELPVASGVLSLHDEVALAGASTIPSARGRGAQRSLLAARLQFAAERGCRLAMMCAAPGTASQRNAERHGFRIAYTRIKWQRRRDTPEAEA